MKNKSFLLGLIFAICGTMSHAQVQERYHQGFEDGEATNFTVTGAAAAQANIFSGGSRALKMDHATTQVVVTTNTIDLRDDASLQHFAFEFSHICYVDPTKCDNANSVALVEAKFAHQSEWTSLHSYYTSNNGSQSYATSGSYSKTSYADWQDGEVSNTMWKTERYDLSSFVNNISLGSRQLQIRVTLKRLVSNYGDNSKGWYIDDMSFRASSQPMVTPSIKMVTYPDLVASPSSSGTKIAAQFTTSVAAGMNSDSVYVLYKVGNSNDIHKLRMNAVIGHAGRYKCYIPFAGYDTMVYFRVVGKDATLNQNAVSYPDGNGWVPYYNIRGKANFESFPSSSQDTSTVLYPFPAYATNKSEFVYDSALMAQAGYKAGGIVAMDIVVKQAITQQERHNVTIRMRNAHNNYSTTTSFSDGYMHPVYEGDLIFPATAANGVLHIALQDTFFYAGADLVVQVMYGDQFQTSDPVATKVETFPSLTNLKTTYVYGFTYRYGYDPYVINVDKFATGMTHAQRPKFKFQAVGNAPLQYDFGIQSIIFPSEENSAMANQDEQIRVRLANFGTGAVTGATIYYQVDDETPIAYDWSGRLMAGATTNVQLTSTHRFTGGYHTLKAWVGDTLMVDDVMFLDFEPYNDTAHNEFIACAGSLQGVVRIGGTNANYATIDEFLFAISRCGVGGALTVKLQEGTYSPLALPEILGVTTSHYIQFEPATTTGEVIFASNAQTNGAPILDLTRVSHVRFKNIKFQHPAGNITSMVELAENSRDCRFINCSFVEPGHTITLISANGTDSLVVEGCNFEGGGQSISLLGFASDNRDSYNTITGSTFNAPNINAIAAQFQSHLTIQENYVHDCLSYNGKLVLVQDCDQVKVQKNKLHSTHGAACLSVNNIGGTATSASLIANNMVLSDLVDEPATMLSPFSIYGGDYLKVVYNTVKMCAENMSNVSAAQLGQNGGGLSHAWFQNNIITTFDNQNYAFTYFAGTNTVVDHNIYYTSNDNLNRYGNQICRSIEEWCARLTTDITSREVNPDFVIAGDPLEMRTYSQGVSAMGTPIAGVTTDIFGTPRDAQNPCPGAFEFEPLYYDFTVVGLEEPLPDYCSAPSSIPLRIKITNSGLRDYVPGTSGTVNIRYSCTRAGATSGANTGTVSLNTQVPTGDTVVFNTGRNLTLTPNGNLDSIYTIHVWVSTTIDPNHLNDTSSFNVIIRSTLPGPTSFSQNVNYASAATLSATQGVVTWETGAYNGFSSEPSTVYWYSDPEGENLITVGNPLVTDPLYNDTTFYVRQKRDLSMIRISEVQFSKEISRGATNPRPSWLNASTNFAIELTNVGDAPAQLFGDTLLVTSNTVAYQNKILAMPNLVIQPGRSVVIQYLATATTTDSTVSFRTSTLTPASTSNLAIVYRHGGRPVDAVVTNGMSVQTLWLNMHMPEQIWKGAGITIDANSAGITRTAWPDPTSAVSNTKDFWRVASANEPLTMGTSNPALIKYMVSECLGDLSSVNVNITNRPAIDLAVEAPVFQDGCGLYEEPVTITVSNHGANTVSNVAVHYSFGGAAIGNGTIPSIGARASVTYTFDQLAPLHASHDTTFHIVAWVDSKTGDVRHNNDTARTEVRALVTPAPPAVAPLVVNYGDRALLNVAGSTSSNPLIWYNNNMEVIDTATTCYSPYLYAADTFFVTASAIVPTEAHVGQLASTSTKSGYPSPFNPYNKYSKQQVIYSAHDLNAAGLAPGVVSGISLYSEDILTDSNRVSFATYHVLIGQVTDTVFSTSTSGSFKTGLDTVFSATNFTVSDADNQGWVHLNFSHNFNWDGVSSIVVQINAQVLGNKDTKGAYTRYTATTAYQALYKASSTNTDAQASGTCNKNRLDILFHGLDYGCQSPASMVPVSVINVPAVEATVDWPDGIDTVQYASCGATPIDVVLLNRGSSVITNYTVNYRIDGTNYTYQGATPIPVGGRLPVTLGQHNIMPGRHSVRVVINAAGDNIHTNDTIYRNFNVKFCTGQYSIGAGRDYETFAAALDTLTGAGVDGAVTFVIASGVYSGRMELGAAPGVSATNTITFVSETGNPEDVVLTTTPTDQDNYVLRIAGNRYVTLSGVTIYANAASDAATTPANALALENCSNISLLNSIIRVKGGLTKVTNSNAITIGSNVHNVTIAYNVIDSGYCAIASDVAAGQSAGNIRILGNEIKGFYHNGIDMIDVDTVSIISNNIHSGVNESSKPITGVSIANHQGAVDIEKNNVVLHDAKNGGKQGIVLENVVASAANRSKIYNNMVSCYGTAGAGIVPTAIRLLSAKYINVYHNSARVYGGLNLTKSYALFVDTGSVRVNVINNIFANYSKGYAYYVERQGVQTSNFNNYYSTATNQLGYWNGTACPSLAALQTANHTDENSLNAAPEFTSEDDLHLLIGQFSSCGMSTPDVADDIDGTSRDPLSPTIGAHEFFCQDHDVSIVSFLSPTWPASIANSPNVETDELLIKVRIFNNGSSTEHNIRWSAEILGADPAIVSTQRTIFSLAPQTMYTDSVYVQLPLGMIDTQYVRAHLTLAGDQDTTNNTRTQAFFVAPAFDLEATEVSIDRTGCYLTNARVSIRFKNVGKKPIPANARVNVGFTATLRDGATVIPTLPYTHTEVAFIPGSVALNASTTVVLNGTANLYPTATDADITVNLKAWGSYQYDLRSANDTATKTNIASYYTPTAPEGMDAYIPYGSWDTLRASQRNDLIIRWYEPSDTTNYTSGFFYNGTGNAQKSTKWGDTPQIFNNRVYYLATQTARGCHSAYSPLHVYVNPRVPTDVSVSRILAPRVSGRVYTEEDTVKVRIKNFGTQPIANIPVVYQVKSSGATTAPVIQTANEVCTTTIQPGDSVDYEFATLLHVDNPTARSTFYLRAWTDLATDQVHLNDTTRWCHDYTFNTIAEPNTSIGTDTNGLNFSKVAFNTLYSEFYPVKYQPLNFSRYNAPEVPPLHLSRGTVDTLVINTVHVDKYYATNVVANFAAWIDFDRDNNFAPSEMVASSLIRPKTEYRFPIEIADTVEYGYMKMRVWVNEDTSQMVHPQIIPVGQFIDYLVFIDKTPADVDAAFCNLVQPKDHIIDTSAHYVAFRLANKGRTPLTDIPVIYSFSDNDTVVSDTLIVAGPLDPGRSTRVTLPYHQFATGTTWLHVDIDVPGDADSTNNSFDYDFHIFKVITLSWDDNLDDATSLWYAPQGLTPYTENLWQRGVPGKTAFSNPPSPENVWATNLNGNVVTGKRGNISYLYTPIMNTSIIRPDTMSFMLNCNLPTNATLTIEYLNYEGHWATLNYEEEQGQVTEWYGEGMDCFTSLNTGGNYRNRKFRTIMVSSEFAQKIQFRIVYATRPGISSTTNYGVGVAIDNFQMHRAQRAVDLGVIDIIEPVTPKFGEFVAPKVVVKNFGYEEQTSFEVRYRPYGSVISKRGIYEGRLRPGDTVHYKFTDSQFLVSSDFPDTFSITAYTVVSEVYHDNDTCVRYFGLSPLNHDLSLQSFVAPTGQVVAGDSVAVTVRMRNYGLQPITQAQLTYVFNEGRQVVSEVVKFDSICGGLGLETLQYCNYTFKQKVRANMGYMQLKAYSNYALDEYSFDDTISGSFEGITNIIDLEATSLILEETGDSVLVSMVINNRGSRAVNSFEVGYMVEDDSTTLYRETYYTEPPLAALSDATHVFGRRLPYRMEGYSNLIGFVHILNDNDSTNDTTRIISGGIVDIKVNKVLVEENRNADCFVRMQVINIGNMPLLRNYRITATVNGRTLTETLDRDLYPGVTYHLDFTQKIPKNSQRQYAGEGSFICETDLYPDNNNTDIVEVINYFEEIDEVEPTQQMTLSQNYPNPFFGSTSIDFFIPVGGHVKFFVLDVMGRTIISENYLLEAGDHTLHFNSVLPATGTYYYGILMNGQRLIRKFVYRK